MATTVDYPIKSSSGQSHSGLNLDDESENADIVNEFNTAMVNDSLRQAIENLIEAIRNEFIQQRQQERKKVQEVFLHRVKEMEKDASRLVKEKLRRARQRDRGKLIEREMLLDELHRNLRDITKEMATQQRLINELWAEIERKLDQSETLQVEAILDSPVSDPDVEDADNQISAYENSQEMGNLKAG